ncbi:STY4534 family ICE replication protein [Histophilus somni]|uniref:STY4534 family ICE replication protein n=1 Tax=Histophilus somni TaxID=731 RepID=UPI00201EC473|nr:STY4534 family ICE replication protein [Histophilus somni]
MSTQNSQQVKYFNLHTTGLGYLNNIRLVEPKKGTPFQKGKPFYSCDIAALVGDSSQPEYRFFNCNVAGKDTENLVKRCQDAVNANKKVLIAFVMSDLRFDTFTYQKEGKNHNKGDTGVALKGRLINIKMIKIDGELKYTSPTEAKTENVENAEVELATPNA